MGEFQPPPPRDDLKWAAVDFDGTIAHSVWTVKNTSAVPGDPIEENKAKLLKLVEDGYKIAIHTSRGWSDYEMIESWMLHHGLPFDKIVCGKLLAKVYIDDRAVNAEGDWTPPK